MEKICGIYCIKNTINGKRYIGSSINIKGRIWVHYSSLRRKIHGNSYLQNAYTKYGKDNFEFTILEAVPEQDLIPREQFWIDFFKSADRSKGYNIVKIVEGRSKMSDESKKKLSRVLKKQFKNGRVPNFLGRTHSEESRKIIGLKSSQKVFSPEFKKNLLLASNVSCFKPVFQLDKNDKIIKGHKSINAAVKYLFPILSEHEITKSRKGISIGKVCNKEESRLTAFGFKWRFQ